MAEIIEYKQDDGSVFKTVKFGNTEFNLAKVPKTKAEFVKKYEGSKVHIFDRNEAWEFLKQFAPKESK